MVFPLRLLIASLLSTLCAVVLASSLDNTPALQEARLNGSYSNTPSEKAIASARVIPKKQSVTIASAQKIWIPEEVPSPHGVSQQNTTTIPTVSAPATPLQLSDSGANFSDLTAFSATDEVDTNKTAQQADRALLTDKAILDALSAYRSNNIKKLVNIEATIQDHPLGSYVRLWSLLLQAKKAPKDPHIQKRLFTFIQKHRDDYVGERAKTDWARIAANDGNRVLFQKLWNSLKWNQTEEDLKCYQSYFLLEQNSKSPLFTSRARETLLTTKTPRSKACQILRNSYLSAYPNWAWSSIIILIQQKQFRLAKEVLKTYKPANITTAQSREIQSILDRPSQWFEKNENRLNAIHPRLLLVAALRLANVKPDYAAIATEAIGKRLPQNMLALAWGRIGYEAAVSHRPEALSWYANAGPSLGRSTLTVAKDQVIIWRVRAALRAHDWQTVLWSINQLSNEQKTQPAWVYWRATALYNLKQTNLAMQQWKSIAKQASFYGLLACDALNQPYFVGVKSLNPPLTPSQIEAFNNNPSLHRATRFYALNLTYEGNREWNWALSNLKPRERLELAEYAKYLQIPHRMINTSKSSNLVVFDQLYPLVHNQEIRAAARQAGLPAAWTFGLIRQESRFISAVSSSVGARGIMQVMPRTARWIAKKIAMTNYKDGHLMQLTTNLTLGTQYLKLVSDSFDGNIVLSTASYNAGPNRATKWRSTLEHPVSGAIFAETIPFGETRDYVLRVTTNTTYYSMYEKQPLRLTDILGTITPQENIPINLP